MSDEFKAFEAMGAGPATDDEAAAPKTQDLRYGSYMTVSVQYENKTIHDEKVPLCDASGRLMQARLRGNAIRRAAILAQNAVSIEEARGKEAVE